jgi:hypothetical protein
VLPALRPMSHKARKFRKRQQRRQREQRIQERRVAAVVARLQGRPTLADYHRTRQVWFDEAEWKQCSEPAP